MPIESCTLPDGGSGFRWGSRGKCYSDRGEAEKQAAAAHANGFVGDGLPRIALDGSARTYDTDGRLHIERSHISKAVVNPYYGMEVPGYKDFGLDPQKIYYFFRPPEELAKAAPTFERLPILSKHIPVSAEAPRQDLIVGSIGSNVIFEDPYLDADTTIWDGKAIAGIETDKVREFSCAYHWLPVMVPGDYNGEHYDGIMTEIRGNHLALVEAGRAGSDVLAADSKILEKREMKMTKLGKALFVTLGTAFPKIAQDSALPALVGEASKKSFDREKVKKAIIALDGTISSEQVDKMFDALLDVEQEPTAQVSQASDEDETEEEKKKREEEEAKKKKTAEDAEAEKDREKKTEQAMDAFKRELREADEARRAVRPVVGEVIAQDTAADIYSFALDQMKIDHKDVKEVPALKALFNLAASKLNDSPAPKIAQDAAGLKAKFPNADRFRLA